MIEIHRVKHRNRKEGDPDHSWVPFVNGRPLANKRHPDGYFFGVESARSALVSAVGAEKARTARIVK